MPTPDEHVTEADYQAGIVALEDALRRVLDLSYGPCADDLKLAYIRAHVKRTLSP